MSKVGKELLINSIKEKIDKSGEFKVTKKMLDMFIDTLVEVVVNELKKGNEVIIKGLGIFKPVDKPSVEKMNNLTGEKIRIPARTVLKFKPSQKVNVLKVKK